MTATLTIEAAHRFGKDVVGFGNALNNGRISHVDTTGVSFISFDVTDWQGASAGTLDVWNDRGLTHAVWEQ